MPQNRITYAIIIALSVLSASSSLAGEPVDLTNPGFEDGLAGWSSWYAKQPTIINFVEHNDGKCLQMLGEAGSRVVVSQTFDGTPQQWYTLSYRYYATPNGQSGGAQGYCRLQFSDPHGKFIDYPNTLALIDTFGEWQEVSQTFQTPLSIGKVTITFNQSGASDLRIDDVSIETTEAPKRPQNTWETLTKPREQPLWFSGWQYNVAADHFRPVAMKYGLRYVLAEQIEEAKESRSIGMWGGDETDRLMREKNVPKVIYLYHGAKAYRDAYYGGTPPEEIPYMVDPVWHDGYIDACRKAIEKYGDDPGIAYLFVQDESHGRWERGVIPMEQRTSSMWPKLDEKIREKYGNGEFGMPNGPNDINPYRWIAYYNWANDQWVDTFRQLREVIDESGCDAKLLGPDELGMLLPLPWGELGQYVDVFTGQALPTVDTARKDIAGFMTKSISDMGGKPVHNASQVVKYAGSPPPERVQEIYSQVLRSGGEGQMLIAVEWFDRELNHHAFSAPARWASIKNMLNVMARTQVKTPRRRDIAIIYSSATAKSRGTKPNSNMYLTAYAMFGPELGCWPVFIDSDALAKGTATLQGFKVAVVADAQYETPAAVDEIREFVRDGGTLVCTDPNALQKSTFGDSLNAGTFLGARPVVCERMRLIEMAFPHAGRQRVYAENCYKLRSASRRTEVIGRYEDGTAAVTTRPFGNGQVLMFGEDPFGSVYASEDTAWQEWWRALLTSHQVALDLPIWKLRLPDETLVQAYASEEVCLTGNAFVRCQNGVYLGDNEAVDGYYTLSVAPDISAESAGTGRIAFAEGDLTDRVIATEGPFKAGDGMPEQEYVEADWANRWSKTAMRNGLTIEFALPDASELRRVVFWYSGAMSEVIIEGGDGQIWKKLATISAKDAREDVMDAQADISGSYSHVRLNFAPVEAAFAISDIEIWGQSK